MWRYLAAVLGALCLIAATYAFVNGRATPQSRLPAAPADTSAGDDETLPDSVPEASARTREQKRFGRYDKDKDGAITRTEYLASRRKAYAKLDVNGDGALSFDEWSIKTTTKFVEADADRSGSMTPKEFAATAPKRSLRAKAKCPPAAAPREEEG